MRAFFPALAIFLQLSHASAAPPLNFLAGPDGEAVSDLEIDLNILPSFEWAADPFLKVPGRGRSPASLAEAELEYKLQATTIDGEDSVAVVNDHVVRVGDRVGRRTVLKIGEDFVLLGERGSVIEASLEAAPETAESPGREPASVSKQTSEPEGQIKIEEVKK